LACTVYLLDWKEEGAKLSRLEVKVFWATQKLAFVGLIIKRIRIIYTGFDFESFLGVLPSKKWFLIVSRKNLKFD